MTAFCKFNVNNFCEAFICFDLKKCSAKDENGRPIYIEYKSEDDIKYPDKKEDD